MSQNEGYVLDNHILVLSKVWDNQQMVFREEITCILLVEIGMDKAFNRALCLSELLQ